MTRVYMALCSLSLTACMSLEMGGQRCSEALECGGEASCYRGFCVHDEPSDLARDSGSLASDAETIVVEVASPALAVDAARPEVVVEEPDAGVESPAPDPEPVEAPLVEDAGAPDSGQETASDAEVKPVDAGKPSCTSAPACSKSKGNSCKPCEEDKGA